jgi:hypothetical protein
MMRASDLKARETRVEHWIEWSTTTFVQPLVDALAGSIAFTLVEKWYSWPTVFVVTPAESTPIHTQRPAERRD